MKKKPIKVITWVTVEDEHGKVVWDSRENTQEQFEALKARIDASVFKSVLHVV